MEPLNLLILASLVAAVCFFAAGFLSGRMRSPAPDVVVDDVVPASAVEQGPSLPGGSWSSLDLQGVLWQLATRGGCDCAALFDDEGLPMAAVGKIALRDGALAGRVGRWSKDGASVPDAVAFEFDSSSGDRRRFRRVAYEGRGLMLMVRGPAPEVVDAEALDQLRRCLGDRVALGSARLTA